MKRALITGIAGQDGSYLAELLISKGYSVFGLARAGSDVVNVPKAVQIMCGDMAEESSLRKAVQESRADEVYNVGGVTDLKTAFGNPELTMKINYDAVGILLDESVKVNPHVKFLQASSSEVFISRAEPLDENSPRDWQTKNPYAKAKMMADRDFVEMARNSGVFACSAILFNHESPRRLKSVMTKIVTTLVNIKKETEKCLMVGNIDMQRDWGFAGDYVDAMWRMLQTQNPCDLVIATGKAHSVKEVIDISAGILGMTLRWNGEGEDVVAFDDKNNTVVQVSPEFYKPSEKYIKVGNISLARQCIGWQPVMNFENLIGHIVDNTLSGTTSLH